MIINDPHRFAFVHIPKCAGTSVREQLKLHDSTNGAFAGKPFNHPKLGRLDTAHLPLRVLRDYFPQAFAKLEAYRTFAIVRDPFERFPSSFYQRMRMHDQQVMETVPQRELEDRIIHLIELLESHGSTADLPHDLIHFQPQSSYILLEGVRKVSDIFSIEDVTLLFQALNKQLGLSPGDQSAMQDASLGKSTQYRLSLLHGIDQKIPMALRSKILALTPPSALNALKSILFQPNRDRFANIMKTSRVRDFIEEFYADDISIYASTK